MTVEEIRERVEKVKQFANDSEVAHWTEDEIYIGVLKAIAEDPTNAQELAREALKADEVEFERWYA